MTDPNSEPPKSPLGNFEPDIRTLAFELRNLRSSHVWERGLGNGQNSSKAVKHRIHCTCILVGRDSLEVLGDNSTRTKSFGAAIEIAQDQPIDSKFEFSSLAHDGELDLSTKWGRLQELRRLADDRTKTEGAVTALIWFSDKDDESGSDAHWWGHFALPENVFRLIATTVQEPGQRRIILQVRLDPCLTDAGHWAPFNWPRTVAILPSDKDGKRRDGLSKGRIESVSINDRDNDGEIDAALLHIVEKSRGSMADEKASAPFFGDDSRLVTMADAYLKLSDSILHEAQRSSWDVARLESELFEASDILREISIAVLPQRIHDPSWTKTAGARQVEAVEKINGDLWCRKDPIAAFQNGRVSQNYAELDLVQFRAAAVRYLDRRHFRTKGMDWLLLDILISVEICRFGEELKRRVLPGPKNILGEARFYEESEGNLVKMRELQFFGSIKRAGKVWGLGVAVPIALAWLSFDRGYETTGIVLGAIGLLVASFWIGIRLLRIAARLLSWLFAGTALEGSRAFGLGLIQRLAGRPSNIEKFQKLYDEMHQAWKLLGLAGASPARVRASLERSSALGAGWDNIAWAIVDRAASLGDRDGWLRPPKRGID